MIYQLISTANPALILSDRAGLAKWPTESFSLFYILFFIHFFKHENIVHWVPQFFMHNKLVLWAGCVLCSNYRKSHAKLAFVIPAGLLPCVYVTESALRVPRSHKNGVISLMEFQEVSVYAIRRCWHFHKFSWEP